MKTLLAIILLIASTPLVAQESADSSDGGAGILYGTDHAFGLSAPPGWVMDNASGVSQGLHAVFYPKGGTWQNSPAVMYANTASREPEETSTLAKLVAFDSTRFFSFYPTVRIGDRPSFLTKDKKQAVVKTFVYSQYEAIAYVEEKTVVVMLVLTARTADQYNSAFPAFENLVGSYFFMTEDVRLR